MHKLDVAFCDTNETYGERFAAYLMEHKAKEFTVHLFPEPELFLQKIKNEKFDLVLLGSGFSEFGEQAVLSGMTVLILQSVMKCRCRFLWYCLLYWQNNDGYCISI